MASEPILDIPRGRLEDDEHRASAIALKSNFPKQRARPNRESGDKIFGPSSKIGNRRLTDSEDPWSHNAWDDVEWDEEHISLADAIIAKQAASPVPEEARQRYNTSPVDFWENFYALKRATFFKDRAWLRSEFSPLAEAVKAGAGPVQIAELGCGPGNTVFPLLAANENCDLHMYALDYSTEAVQLVKANPAFNPRACTAVVWDIASPTGPPQEIAPGSLDIAILIFVFSALHPDEWMQAVRNLYAMLKPGGIILFRDYGRNDLAQLRMKGGRYMQDNLYIRGDGTRVYFFETEEIVAIFNGTNGVSQEPPVHTQRSARFDIVKLGVDQRLLLNRARRLKMYRVWHQGEFRKPLSLE